MSTPRDPEPDQPPTAPKRLRGRILAAVCVLVAVWAVTAGYLVVSGTRSANRAADSIESFSEVSGGDLMNLTHLVEGDIDLRDLRAAEKSVGSAHARFRSPILGLLKPIPVIGRQIRSARALTGSSLTVTRATLDAFSNAHELVESQDNSTSTGDERIQDRLTAAADLEALLSQLQIRIDDIDLGPADGLFSPLAKARNRFSEQYDEARTTLDDALAGVKGTRAFLGGPEQYLVLAANNGEMRAGSGMFLQIGVMATSEGRFQLGEFTPAGDMFLAHPGARLDPTLEALWGPLTPTQEWRNLNLTPRFDESARMASEMWKSSGRGKVDGAMAIDVVGLRKLLRVSGPVSVTDDSGQQSVISADNVLQVLLVEQYKALTSSGQDERRAHLGDVAAAIFESFNSGNVPLADMIEAFTAVGRGRHLMMWSSDPVQQAGWVSLGLSGTLAENDVMLSVINRGGNKLDQFLEISSELSSKTADSTRHLEAKVTLTNTSPAGLPRYVEGPVAGLGLAAGDYLGYLSLTVPGGAGDPTATGAEIVGTAIDGPTKIIVIRVLIPRGETKKIELGFDLPTAWKSINVIPSARFPSVAWSAGSRKWDDNRARELTLDKLG
ncbi:MAG: DUF4012 domain-containing protein [Microthrixaceae bacterium]